VHAVLRAQDQRREVGTIGYAEAAYLEPGPPNPP
jgi:hypothetical protein